MPIRSWVQAEISLRSVLFGNQRRREQRGVLFVPVQGAVMLKPDKLFAVLKPVRTGELFNRPGRNARLFYFYQVEIVGIWLIRWEDLESACLLRGSPEE